MYLLSQKQQTATTKTLLILGLLFFISLFSNSISAQENYTVKGNVASEVEPLSDVSIFLKGTRTGTVSKNNGDFTFPTKLKNGDILVFSYLGFKNQSVIISENNTNLNIILTEEVIDVLSALNSNKPYKSKRRN